MLVRTMPVPGLRRSVCCFCLWLGASSGPTLRAGLVSAMPRNRCYAFAVTLGIMCGFGITCVAVALRAYSATACGYMLMCSVRPPVHTATPEPRLYDSWVLLLRDCFAVLAVVLVVAVVVASLFETTCNSAGLPAA